jgi:PAS domain S-box-containing protein
MAWTLASIGEDDVAENALTLPASARSRAGIPTLLARHPAVLAVLASLAGIASAWLTGSPLALLAPVAALFLHAPGRALPVLLGGTGLGFAVALLVALGNADPRWPALLGLALCVGAMLAASRVQSGRADGERALRIVEGMPGHAWSADPEGRYTYVSPRTLAFLGRRQAELDPAADAFGWRSVVHPDDYDRVAARWRHCLATGEAYDAEHRMRRADGVWRWFRNAGWASRDADGRIVAWYGTTTDVDDEKRAEAALRARERELTELVDMVPSHLWRLAPDGEPVFFNRRMVDFLGFDVAATERPGVSRLDALVADAVHPEDAAALSGALRRSLATGEPFAMRYRLRRADGAWHWMSSRAAPLRDETGAVVQWYGLCHDIDAQVHAEEALRRSERGLQQMIDAMPALIWCMDADGRPSYLNRRLIDFLGLDLAQLTAAEATRTLADIHPEDRQAVEAALSRSLGTGAPFAMTYRQRRSDGRYRWTEGRAEPLRDEAGAVLQWYGVCVDVDDLVRAREGLERRERQLQQLIDALPVQIVSWTAAGEITYVSRQYLEQTGLSDPTFEEFLRATVDLVHPDDLERVRDGAAQARRFGTAFAMRYRRRLPDGSFRWLDGRFEPQRAPDGTITEWFGLSIDIDDEIRVQEELRERERELQQLVDMVPSHVWRMTPEGEPTFFNKRMVDFLGLDVADTVRPGMSRLEALMQAVHPDDATAVADVLGRSLVTGEPYAMKYRVRRADGAYRWVDGRGEPVRDQGGTIVQWYAVSMDVDDQMRLYGEIEEREAKIRRLVDSDIIGIVIWDLDGRLIDANDAFLEMIQCDRADMEAGIRWFDMTPPEWQEVHAREEAEELATTGKMQPREKEYFRKDGSRVPVLIGAACFEGDSRQGVAYILDLTQRKRAEAAQLRAEEALRQASVELARATQAASLAELSASIAHEVNQPLAAIVANSSACHRWLSAAPPNIERAKITAERIVRDANAAADVIDRIRAVFRRSPERPGPAALGPVVLEARDLMAEEAARRRVGFEIEAAPSLPPVALDRVQIQQVLVNLIRNGIEAMEETAGERVIRIRLRRDGDALRTEVGDTGPGLAFPERVFQPFFTTKPTGMGMGLAICRSIVEAHGGRLWAERAAPQGATFVFTLPIAAKEE